MTAEQKKEMIALLKLDLGISHNKRDAYFDALMEASEKELIKKGISLDFADVDDKMLCVDYAAWKYRNREKDMELAKNISSRIRRRATKKRSQKRG